jgi:class 3 adenylate cyclase
MKILWCDDQSLDEIEFQKFLDDWDLRNRRTDVLRAFDDQSALDCLKSDSSIGLLILDLLWGDEPEHQNLVPTGVRILERLRASYPKLWVVTRSKIDDSALLARLVQSFSKLGVSDHFRSPDRAPIAMLRKHVIVEMIDKSESTAEELPSHGLGSFLGDSWSVVMFADVSGFTAVTEQLWHQNRTALCGALEDFYGRAGQMVTKHRGVIDKFIGDELMAMFFLRKGEQKTAVATRAIDCARDLIISFRDLELSFKKAMTQEDDLVSEIEWTLKIGMEAGAVRIMKQMLPNGELEYCAVGPAINVASRIKGKAGPYSITLGQSLHSKLTNETLYQCEELAIDGQLKGVHPTYKLFKLSRS